METILKNPGLLHLAENIFLNLETEDLEVCEKINQSSKQILEDPSFWLWKLMLKGLPEEKIEDWKKAIKLAKTTDLYKNVNLYLKWKLKQDIVDVPCYSSPYGLEDFMALLKADISLAVNEHYVLIVHIFLDGKPWTQQTILMFQIELGKLQYKGQHARYRYIEIVKILALLADNPNPPDFYGDTPIIIAAWEGHTEMVKILAPLTENPNAPDSYGRTPILVAAKGLAKGRNTEIVKILAPLTDNPNAPDEDGCTPIYQAACNGYTEIVKLLAPLTDNPNAPHDFRGTPIYRAAVNGHTEIVKILAPLTDDPNAPNKDGDTPIHVAALKGHTEIVKILAPLTSNPNAPNKKNGHTTPIHKAAWNSHTEIVKILAPLTDNPNAPDEDGRTPIFWAAFKGNTEIVKILAPLTNHPSAPDIYGVTPIVIAKNEEIKEILSSIKTPAIQNE